MNSIRKTTKTLLDADTVVGLQGAAEKTKYDHVFGMIMTNQNCILGEDKEHIDLWECFLLFSSESLSVSCLKTLRFNAQNYNLAVVSYGCEILSVTVRGQHRFRCLRTECQGEYVDLRERKW
jgi:hypothetical protein